MAFVAFALLGLGGFILQRLLSTLVSRGVNGSAVASCYCLWLVESELPSDRAGICFRSQQDFPNPRTCGLHTSCLLVA